METSTNLDHSADRISRPSRCHDSAFSLVEIALALGIIAFGLVAVFGLMPLGLSSFKKAMDISVGAQIAQVVIDDAQQSEFSSLINGQTVPFAQAIRYFDEQGTEGKVGQVGMIYEVNTRIAPSTSMPETTSTGSGAVNVDIATVTVQVANDPGNQTPTLNQNDSTLWVSSSTIPVTTFSTYIARNSPGSTSTP